MTGLRIVQVVSAAHARPAPIHAARHTGNGWTSLCGVGARGLAPVLDLRTWEPQPYRIREEGDGLHCARCEAAFLRLDRPL